VPALVCAGTLLLAARRAAIPLAGVSRFGGAAAAVVLAVLAVAAYGGNRELALGEQGSEEAARRAARLQPWSGEPWRLLGESQLARGEVAAARKSFREGLERDADEWELWLDLALATSGRERGDALDRAAELDPLATQIAELRAGA
jgi:Flp pilus assembly protein TadD